MGNDRGFWISHTSMTDIATAQINWMAPELLLDYVTPTQSSDVWAFSRVCYEVSDNSHHLGPVMSYQSKVFTGEIPFSQYRGILLLMNNIP
jgi:hypothetical protein